MSELVERAENALTNAAGDIVNPAVATLLATAGVALNKPELVEAAVAGGVVAGALTTEVFGAGLGLVRRAWQDRADRAARFAETAAQEAGVPIEDLIASAEVNPKLRELLAQAVSGSAESFDNWKIDTLARAFAHGFKDPAKIDEMRLLAHHLLELDVPHVRVLAALHRANRFLTMVEFRDHDRALTRVVAPLVAHLKDRGLVEDQDRSLGLPADQWAAGPVTLTHVGGFVAEVLAEVGAELPPVG